MHCLVVSTLRVHTLGPVIIMFAPHVVVAKYERLMHGSTNWCLIWAIRAKNRKRADHHVSRWIPSYQTMKGKCMDWWTSTWSEIFAQWLENEQITVYALYFVVSDNEREMHGLMNNCMIWDICAMTRKRADHHVRAVFRCIRQQKGNAWINEQLHDLSNDYKMQTLAQTGITVCFQSCILHQANGWSSIESKLMTL
jgi:hypothetical protein